MKATDLERKAGGSGDKRIKNNKPEKTTLHRGVRNGGWRKSRFCPFPQIGPSYNIHWEVRHNFCVIIQERTCTVKSTGGEATARG